MNKETFQKIKIIFIDILDDDDIVLTETSTADDVEEWDSITHIEIISEIESVFDIRFNTMEIESLKNLGDMVSLVSSKTKV